MYCSHYITSFGPGSVYATDAGVTQVVIPNVSAPTDNECVQLQEYEVSDLTVCAASMLQRYFKGERIEFNDVPVDLGSLTEFRCSVLAATRNLMYGDVCSYGQLARLCGSPRAARAIGGALAVNPVPVIIPCHRVAGADGRLTGFSAPGGENTKMALLKMEGVEFKGVLVVTNQLVMNSNSRQ